MANIAVVDFCNMKCPYCFASEHMRQKQAKSRSRYISMEAFEQRLDFLDRSKIDEARLIGGEPTLHPQFAELVCRARLRNKKVTVFSNGLMPERAIRSLECLPEDQCSVLINTNAMKTAQGPSAQEQSRREKTLRRLGSRAVLGYNIYATSFDIDHLLPIIQETKCRPAIRVGLAHPILGGQNAYLHPKDYAHVGRKLVEFCQRAQRVSVALQFDCGFVRCMFSDQDIEILQEAKADVGWRCSPVLDIDIDGHVIRCFPFTERAEGKVDSTSEAVQLISDLEARAALYQRTGIYKECSCCAFRTNGACSGGGLEHTVRRFRESRFRVDMSPAGEFHS